MSPQAVVSPQATKSPQAIVSPQAPKSPQAVVSPQAFRSIQAVLSPHISKESFNKELPLRCKSLPALCVSFRGYA